MLQQEKMVVEIPIAINLSEELECKPPSRGLTLQFLDESNQFQNAARPIYFNLKSKMD